eukprot:CAMPEP_0170176738 /NCGR_PEP_ID=MMETSP0040_2-20121228/9545_1 /TAXON_ID=641309 /ORGANISM="Lotharella oceanica, Strain CCMP622" /LENGTH=409 /DNA_ID=CAMNT_0010419155 /DNA_START=55 /DNA_END=1284 /DNA_ORIENTATION=-
MEPSDFATRVDPLNILTLEELENVYIALGYREDKKDIPLDIQNSDRISLKPGRTGYYLHYERKRQRFLSVAQRKVTCTKCLDYYNLPVLLCATPVFLLWFCVQISEEEISGRGRWGLSAIPLWLLLFVWLVPIVINLYFLLHNGYLWVRSEGFYGMCCLQHTIDFARGHWLLGVFFMEMSFRPNRLTAGIVTIFAFFAALLTLSILITIELVHPGVLPVYSFFLPIWFMFLIFCTPICLCHLEELSMTIVWIFFGLPFLTFFILLNLRLQTDDKSVYPLWAVLFPLLLIGCLTPTVVVCGITWEEVGRRTGRFLECIIMFFGLWLLVMGFLVGPFLCYQIMLCLWDAGKEDFRNASAVLYATLGVLVLVGFLLAITSSMETYKAHGNRREFRTAFRIPAELEAHDRPPV